jgi:hypothetical protein
VVTKAIGPKTAGRRAAARRDSAWRTGKKWLEVIGMVEETAVAEIQEEVVAATAIITIPPTPQMQEREITHSPSALPHMW